MQDFYSISLIIILALMSLLIADITIDDLKKKKVKITFTSFIKEFFYTNMNLTSIGKVLMYPFKTFLLIFLIILSPSLLVIYLVKKICIKN